MRQEQRMPNAEESIKFWSELWDSPVDHDRNPEWIMTVEKELECVTHKVILISLRRMFSNTLGKYQIGKRQVLMDYMDNK